MLKKQQKIILLVGLITAAICLKAIAQDKGDQKISIEIKTEKDGVVEAFKKTYSSMEEMNNDPEYQKYNGGKSGTMKGFTWSSADGDDGQMQRSFTIITDKLQKMVDSDSLFIEIQKKIGKTRGMAWSDEGGARAFKWELDTDSLPRKFRFSGFPQEMIIEMEKMGNDSMLAKVIGKNMGEFKNNFDVEAFMESDGRMKEFDFSRRGGSAIINDLDPLGDATYIKTNKYDPAKAPKLDGLTFEKERAFGPDRAKRYRLSFNVGTEQPMTIKLTSSTGEVVYVEGSNAFKGTYERTINFENQNGKEFLLEVSLGKQKAIKRVVLD